jgi:hypothetical protein
MEGMLEELQELAGQGETPEEKEDSPEEGE